MDHFNIDTNAIGSRADINARRGKYDLEKWMIKLLPPMEGFSILDLGCGTGKQVFRFAALVSDGGRILSIDISKDSVDIVNQRAKAEGLKSVEAQQISFDDCLNSLKDRKFDLIISSYAIYYAQDVVALLMGLRSLLTDQGVVFVCGPGGGTNSEMDKIVNGFVRNARMQLKPINDFLKHDEIQEIAAVYSRFSLSRLENQILFDSADTILSWWQNHKSYVPSVAVEVESFFRRHFETNDTFVLTKNVLGVRFDI